METKRLLWGAVAALLFWSGAAVTSETMKCNVLLGTSGKAPYLENTSGDILSTFNAAVLGQLIQTDRSYSLEPGLISEFEYDFKKNRYILKLQKGLKFHDGREVSSKDLEYSILRGFFSKNSSFYRVYLANIEGIESVDAKKEYKSGSVSGVKIIDEVTVSVQLSSPNPSFLHTLTNPYFSLVPREHMKSDNVSWKRTPIGAGPYRVVDEGFKDGKVQLELVQRTSDNILAPQSISLFTSRVKGTQFDVVHSSAIEGGSSNYNAVLSDKPAAVRALFFSNRNELGVIQAFRKAVQLLVNREEFARTFDSMSPASQILPRHFWGRSTKEIEFDLEKARELLKTIPKDLLSKEWEVPIYSDGPLSEEKRKLGDVLVRQFLKVGLKIKITTFSEKFPTLESAIKYPMRLTGRVTDYLDPLIMFASLRSGSPYIYDQPVGDSRKKFDELYDRAANAATYDQRIETVRLISDFVQERAIAVALAEEKIVYYLNSSRVKGLGYQPQPLTLFLQNLILNTKD